MRTTKTSTTSIDEDAVGPQSFFRVSGLSPLPRAEWVFANELVPKQQRRGRAFIPRDAPADRVTGLTVVYRRRARPLRAASVAQHLAGGVASVRAGDPAPGCVPAPHRYRPRIGVR